MDRLIFVDCEAIGPCPGLGHLTEFGAVHYTSRNTFHGDMQHASPDSSIGRQVFIDFSDWIWHQLPSDAKRPIMVSDNPAFDFQWINHGFWYAIKDNPFGHSARRIGDFYAGLVGDWRNTQRWKGLRITKHDHNPVHDSLGNVEAFERILAGELGLKKLPSAIGCAVMK